MREPNPLENPTLTPDLVAEFRKKAGIPENKPPSSNRKNGPESIKQDMKALLTIELVGLKAAVQAANISLDKARKSNHTPGVELPTFDPEAIDKAEKNLLGCKIRFQCLEESLLALANDQPLPADLRATLQLLENESEPGSARQKGLHALLIQLP